MVKEINVMVEAGNAKPGPQFATLSQLGIDVKKVIQEINEKTKDLKGLQLPVKIIVDENTKEFKIEVGMPPVSELIKKFAKFTVERKNKKGKLILAQQPVREWVADISLDDVIKIAKMKISEMPCTSLKSAVKTILGTCYSSGVLVDGKNPREVIREIDEGKYDDKLKE